MANLRSLLPLLSGLLILGTAAAPGADGGERDRRGPPRVILFERPHFAGASVEIELGAVIPDLADLRFANGGRVNNRVSSIRIERGAQVRIYEDDQFFGEYLELSRSVENLTDMARAGGQNWNDTITSLRVFERRSGRLRGRDPSRTPRVIVFSRKNYGGEAFELFPGETLEDLNREHFESGRDLNDEISSLRIVGPVRIRLYYDKKLNGEYIDLINDAADLNRLRRSNPEWDWNDKTSSLKVEWVGPPPRQAPEPDDNDDADDRNERRDDRRNDDDRRGRR